MPTRREQSKAASALRGALAAKTSLRTHFDIAVESTEVIEAAQRRLNAARQLEVATMLSDDTGVQERAAGALREAEEARDACFHRVYCRGLTLDEFDALVALNPPTDAQAREGRSWGNGFDIALLTVCAEDSDLTREEWEEQLTTWTAAERRRAIAAALEAQRQTLADAVPKD